LKLRSKNNLDDLKNIPQAALEILSIAEELTNQKKPLDIETLYREAKKRLKLPEREINNTIYELILKKIIIPEKKLVKTQVLANQKRDAIYQYIIKNPGAHLREIRDKLNLQPHVTNLHLKILENFKFVYRKNYLKYLVYFPSDFLPENEEAILALKNANAKLIFTNIFTNDELTLNQLKQNLAEALSPKMVDYHLEPLLTSKLIINFEKDGQTYLKLGERVSGTLEKYLKPTMELEKEVSEAPLLIKRAYDYVGASIRFKVVVENKAKENIKEISVMLNIKEQFEVAQPTQKIMLLEPEESRGVDFSLVPLTCGKSKIYGTVIYHDNNGRLYSSEINPLIVQIKCPLVQPRVLKLLDVLKMKEKFQVSHVEIPYREIAKADAFRIAREQIASLDVSLLDEGEPLVSLFTGEAKITGNPILVDLHMDDKNIIIDVYMEDLKQSTGFIAYIKNLINMSLSYTMKISTSVEKVRAMIFNGFEFSTRLTELFDLCNRQESADDILLLLKELQIKAQSYFPDLKLTETLNNWFQQLEKYQEKEIYSRTYKNLQFDIQTWMESIIIFAETNANIYYEAAIDETTRSEIARETSRLKESLHQIAFQYSKQILYTFMLIHKNTGLSLFNYNFSEQSMDSDLISGFLQAITSFGTELSHQETKMQRLSYEYFEIEIADGNFCVGALVTSGFPNPLTSTALSQFVQRFETKFKHDLESFAGNVSQFGQAQGLIQEIFL